jgi:oligopeptidase A
MNSRGAARGLRPLPAEAHAVLRTERGQNRQLFEAYRDIHENGEDLSPEQRKVLENALRDFHLSGVDLPADKKARFKAISQELSRCPATFRARARRTNAWSQAHR